MRDIVARRHATDEEKYYEASTLLEEAISRFEAFAREGAEEPSKSGPIETVLRLEKQAVSWGTGLYNQLKSKYGALLAGVTALIDFLKPVIDFAPLVLLASGIAGLFSFLAARRSKANRQKLMNWAYLSALFFISSGGWLLVTTFVPAAKAGVAAQVVPGVAELQEKLVKILSGIAHDTKRTADSAANIDRKLDSLQQEIDPKAQIQKAGYTSDGAGYVRAIAEGSHVRYLFQTVGIQGSATDLREAMLDPKRDQQSFARLVDALGERDPAGFVSDVAGVLRKDLSGLATGRLDSFRVAACAPQQETLLAKLTAARLSDRCADEAAWLAAVFPFLANLLEKVPVPDLDLASVPYSPSRPERVTAGAFVDLLAGRSDRPRIVESKVLAGIGAKRIDVFDESLERQVVVGALLARNVTGPCVSTVAGLRSLCEATISILFAPGVGARVLSIGNVTETPRALSLRAFLGSGRAKAGLVVTREYFEFSTTGVDKSAMLRDQQDRALVRLSCQSQRGVKFPILYFGSGAGLNLLADELFSKDGLTTNDPVFLQFDKEENATKWPTSGAIGRFSHYVTLSSANISQMKARSSMTIYMGGRALGTFDLRGLASTIDAAFKSAGC